MSSRYPFHSGENHEYKTIWKIITTIELAAIVATILLDLFIPTLVIIGLLIVSLLIRFGLAGKFGNLAALIAGLLFIPSLALALGVWTGTSKAFEVVYAVFWYLGVLYDVLELNYSGLHASSNCQSISF